MNSKIIYQVSYISKGSKYQHLYFEEATVKDFINQFEAGNDYSWYKIEKIEGPSTVIAERQKRWCDV